ncbi:MAG: putative lipid II flippase FtsW [Patescibacteria group bacterium]
MALAGNAKKADRFYMVSIGILLAFGLFCLTSASAPVGYSVHGDTYYFIKSQLLKGVLPGLLAFLICARFNTDLWRKLGRVFYIACLALLVMVFIPHIGTSFGKGAASWINLGFMHFQPAELAKLAIIFIMADLLSDPDRNLHDWKNGLLPVLGVIAPALLLIAVQPDIGTLVVIAGMVVGILFVAGTSKPILAALAAAGVVAVIILIITAPYRSDRLKIFLHPELDPQGIGYHVSQAYLAIGSGGWGGLGYGHSRQKYQYLPEVEADSIFAIISEEMGFVISCALIGLILLIAWRGLKIAKEAPDRYGFLLACGVSIWFFWQACMNIGAMVGLLPLTGVTLPFVSHGGSSMLVCLAAAGVVASVSRE